MMFQSLVKNRWCIALKYTKLKQFKTTLALWDSWRNIAILIKDKKIMIQKTVFFSLPQSILRKYKILAGIAYIIIIKELI